MSKENTRERKLQLAFGAHPKADAFYVTSDHHAFFNEQDAKAHAIKLEDKEVERAERRDYVKATVSAEGDTENKEPSKPKAPAKKRVTSQPKASRSKAGKKASEPVSDAAKVEEPGAGDPPSDDAAAGEKE